jgi:hypothetical protein
MDPGNGTPPVDVAQTAHDSTVSATTEAQTRFLDAFAELGTVKEAARAAGIGRRTHYFWLETDESYRQRFKDAEQEAADTLLAEARRRALDRSDKLLLEMLRAHMPETFARRLEHTGKNGAPIAHSVAVRRDLSALTDAQLEAAEDIARTNPSRCMARNDLDLPSLARRLQRPVQHREP